MFVNNSNNYIKNKSKNTKISRETTHSKKIISLGPLILKLTLHLVDKDLKKFSLSAINSILDLKPILKSSDYLNNVYLSSSNKVFSSLLFLNKASKTKSYIEFFAFAEPTFSKEESFLKDALSRTLEKNFIFISYMNLKDSYNDGKENDNYIDNENSSHTNMDYSNNKYNVNNYNNDSQYLDFINENINIDLEIKLNGESHRIFNIGKNNNNNSNIKDLTENDKFKSSSNELDTETREELKDSIDLNEYNKSNKNNNRNKAKSTQVISLYRSINCEYTAFDYIIIDVNYFLINETSNKDNNRFAFNLTTLLEYLVYVNSSNPRLTKLLFYPDSIQNQSLSINNFLQFFELLRLTDTIVMNKQEAVFLFSILSIETNLLIQLSNYNNSISNNTNANNNSNSNSNKASSTNIQKNDNSNNNINNTDNYSNTDLNMSFIGLDPGRKHSRSTKSVKNMYSNSINNNIHKGPPPTISYDNNINSSNSYFNNQTTLLKSKNKQELIFLFMNALSLSHRTFNTQPITGIFIDNFNSTILLHIQDNSLSFIQDIPFNILPKRSVALIKQYEEYSNVALENKTLLQSVFVGALLSRYIQEKTLDICFYSGTQLMIRVFEILKIGLDLPIDESFYSVNIKKEMIKKIIENDNRKNLEENFTLDCMNRQSSILKPYDPLVDTNLSSFFTNDVIRKHLIKIGVIDNNNGLVKNSLTQSYHYTNKNNNEGGYYYKVNNDSNDRNVEIRSKSPIIPYTNKSKIDNYSNKISNTNVINVIEAEDSTLKERKEIISKNNKSSEISDLPKINDSSSNNNKNNQTNSITNNHLSSFNHHINNINNENNKKVNNSKSLVKFKLDFSSPNLNNTNNTNTKSNHNHSNINFANNTLLNSNTINTIKKNIRYNLINNANIINNIYNNNFNSSRKGSPLNKRRIKNDVFGNNEVINSKVNIKFPKINNNKLNEQGHNCMLNVIASYSMGKNRNHQKQIQQQDSNFIKNLYMSSAYNK